MTTRVRSSIYFQVFVAEDVHLIVEALESIYPYSYSVVHDKNGNVALNGFSLTPACSSATFAPFAACLQTNCNSATSQDALVACLLSNCILQFVDLSDECVACFRTSALDFTRFVMRFFNYSETSNAIAI